MKITTKYWGVALTATLVLPLSAAFRLDFVTDATGTPTTGSYSGSGAVDSNIVSGVAGHQIIGVASGDILTVDLIDQVGGPHNFAPDILSVESTFNIVGGTADLTFADGGDYFKGWSISNLSGVESFSFTSVFSDPISGRTDSTGSLVGRPWGFATALQTIGTGFGITDFEVTYTIGGVQYLVDNTDPSTATSSLPTYTAYASSGWDNSSTPDTLVFESLDGFEGTANGSSTNNLLVRGFDDDGGSLNAANVLDFWADEFIIEITPGGGETEFASDTVFNFSFDGDRSLVIPEPSSLGLLSLGSLFAIGRRKR